MSLKYLVITTFALFLVGPLAATATADEASNQILRKLEQMEREISGLKAELKRVKEETKQNSGVNTGQSPAVATVPSTSKSASSEIDEALFRPQGESGTQMAASELDQRVKELGAFGITYRSSGFVADSLRLGAYGETIFGRKNSGAGWNNGFDANRLVLLGAYPITEDIIFNTELEFEHGGIAKDADDKLNGAIELEQLFVDIRANDFFTWRSPGVDIVPVGYVGLFHEPTQFYSTNRPEIYDDLIPSTWFAPATSAYGKIVDGLTYQFQISSALEDAGTVADDEDGNVPDGGYDPGISGAEALGLSRAPIGDRLQLSNALGYALRFAYTPVVIPGLSGSTSFYYTNDTTPRGAYGTNANGSTRPLGKSSLNMVNTELRYRVPATGLEFRTEYVRTAFGDSDNLRANNDTDPSNNVGDSMYGYSFEGAYHFNLSEKAGESWELVPFYRFSNIKLQTGGVSGTDENDPTGSGNRDYHTFGAALFPTPKLVLKLDYQIVEDDDSSTSDEQSLLGSVGFFF